MIVLDLLILLSSLFVLGLVSDKVIQYVTKISKIIGFSEIAAGFILLSVATSLPELSISIIASVGGEGGLSLGNVLGSNIANLTIIMGLAIVLSKNRYFFKECPQKELLQFLFLSSIIPLFIIEFGRLNYILGVVLLILFIYFSITLSKRIPVASNKETENSESTKSENANSVLLIVKFFIGMAIIVLSSRFTVESSLNIATFFELPPSVLGATIVGTGTSLPELVTSIQAFKKGLFNMGFGNLIGSCITNITLVLGAASIITSSKVNIAVTQSLIFFVLLSALVIWYLLSTRRTIDRNVGYFLIGLYIVFILQELGISLFIF